MNKRLLAFVSIFTIVFIAFMQYGYSYKIYAPTGLTNAPGEQTCRQCHGTYPLQTTLGNRITITADGNVVDENFTYTLGQTYAMNISIDQGHTRNGFSLTLLNESNLKAGTLATSDVNAQKSSFNSKDYIGHNANGGVSSWNFDWTAPADSQVVTIYNVVNLTNGNNNDNGDSILTKQITFTAEPSTPNAIKDVAITDHVRFINPAINSQLEFSIDAQKSASYEVQLFDLKGAMLFNKSYYLHYGINQIAETVHVQTGLYIAKIKTGKQFSSYKVVF